MSQIPYGYCQCGCGQKTKTAKQTESKRGYVKGKPMAYLAGHNGRVPARERFWKHVEIRGQNECWEWKANRSRKGYGRFKGDDRKVVASRFAWELTNGPIPKGMDVMHLCDNPPCCNPAHLTIGTRADNIHDCITKGRRNIVKGSKNGQSKLREFDVQQARALRAQGMYFKDIAARFGVTPDTIRQAIVGNTWKDIT